MGRGRNKGRQSGGFVSKAERARHWVKTVRDARWEMMQSSARPVVPPSTSGVAASNPAWKRPVDSRHRVQLSARWLESYLSAPSSTRCRRGYFDTLAAHQQMQMQAAAQQAEENPEKVIDRVLTEEAEFERDGEVPSLVDLCARRIGEDLPVYGDMISAPSSWPPQPIHGRTHPHDKSPPPRRSATHHQITRKEEEEEEESMENARATQEYLMETFALLPPRCVEVVSLYASRHRHVNDKSLPLLCQAGVTRLYIVGPVTDQGLARSLFPRQHVTTRASWDDSSSDADSDAEAYGDPSSPTDGYSTYRQHSSPPTTSPTSPSPPPSPSHHDNIDLWTTEPRFAGCLSLTSLTLHSPHVTPDFLTQLSTRIPSVTHLSLPACFNGIVTLAPLDALRAVSRLPRLQRVDLRGCVWMGERAVVRWVEEVLSGCGVDGDGGRDREEGDGRGLSVSGSGGSAAFGVWGDACETGRSRGNAGGMGVSYGSRCGGTTTEDPPLQDLRVVVLRRDIADSRAVVDAFEEHRPGVIVMGPP